MPKDWFKLSKQKIKELLIFYIIVLVIGLIISIAAIVYESIEPNFLLPISTISIIGSIGTSLCGSAIFYLRKLYRSCINLDIEEPVSDKDKIREIGVWAYLFLRPFFAVVFSILIIIALKGGVLIITVTEVRLNEGFIYLTMLLSFFAGFSSGDLIDYFEDKGKDFAEKAFKRL